MAYHVAHSLNFLMQRLCANEEFCTLLLECHSLWVDGLLEVYSSRGGMKRRAGGCECVHMEVVLGLRERKLDCHK